ncbi:MAG: hypothetical protein JF587_08310 [Catenulisporales bacterium]|jgi:hypothetical protein|nr:hypothetical protein [Catenulisporales bacterium]
MTRIVSDGVHVVRATGQRVLDGVGAAAEEVRHEAHKAREHLPGNGKSGKTGRLGKLSKSAKAKIGKPGKSSGKTSMMRSRTAELVASTAGAIAAFVVTALVRGRFRDRKK